MTDNGQIIDSISQKDYKFYWNPVLGKIEHSQKVNYNLSVMLNDCACLC